MLGKLFDLVRNTSKLVFNHFVPVKTTVKFHEYKRETEMEEPREFKSTSTTQLPLATPIGPQLPSVAPVLSPTQVACRALANAVSNAALSPLARAHRKLVKAREAGSTLTYAQSFKMISADNPYKGFFSRTSSDLLKSALLFQIQSKVGGHVGYGLGGLVQGALGGMEQVLDYRLVKNPQAKHYFHAFRGIPTGDLYRMMRWPVGVSAISSGVFWAGFTQISDLGEVKAKELIEKYQLQDSVVASVSPFGVRFLSALAVGSLTYPAYRVIQLKVTNPDISLFVLKKAESAKIRELTFTIRRPYCSYPSGILIFAVNRAVGLSAAYAADTFYQFRLEYLEKAKQERAKREIAKQQQAALATDEQTKKKEVEKEEVSQMRVSKK